MAQDHFIVDAHNDLLMEVEFRSGDENPFAATWLGNLRQGGVRLQVCPVGVHLDRIPDGALRQTLQQIVACHRAVRDNPEQVMLIRSRGDLDALEAGDRIGLMLSMEGADALGSSPELADAVWELGVRMVALTWNMRNAFADGLGELCDGGLSNVGRELVARLVELGVILDLAHASERTFEQVLELNGDAPIVVSHAGCRTIADFRRNVSDDQMRALAERGGVLAIMALPLAIDPERQDNWTIDRMVDHIDHAVDLIGIDHVGLGGDFIRQVGRSGCFRDLAPAEALLPPGMNTEAVLEGLPGPENYANLVEVLQRRGYEGERLGAILGGNLLRLFRDALP